MSQKITATEQLKSEKIPLEWVDCDDVFLLYKGELHIQINDAMYNLRGEVVDATYTDIVESLKEVKITYVKN